MSYQSGIPVMTCMPIYIRRHRRGPDAGPCHPDAGPVLQAEARRRRGRPGRRQRRRPRPHVNIYPSRY